MHVERDEATCKFWLQPLSLADSYGFSPKELNRIRGVIQARLALIEEAWNEHCGAR